VPPSQRGKKKKHEPAFNWADNHLRRSFRERKTLKASKKNGKKREGDENGGDGVEMWEKRQDSVHTRYST